MAEKDANGKTLESRIYAGAREGLKGGDGHYYALPHYEWFPGLIYDKDAFDKYGWYIAKEGQGSVVNNKYGSITITKTAANKSCGPDGKTGTEDDGLPSSLEELIVLSQKIKDDAKIAAFTVSGAILYNSNYLVDMGFACGLRRTQNRIFARRRRRSRYGIFERKSLSGY